MIFKVKMIVQNFPLEAVYGDPPDPTDVRIVETKFAGCTDEADAKQKARSLYDVVSFKKVEPVE